MNFKTTILLLVSAVALSSCSNTVKLTGVKTVLVNPASVERVGTLPNYLHFTPDPELVEHFVMQYEHSLRILGADVLRFPEPNAIPPRLDTGTILIYVRRLQIKEQVDTSKVNPDDMAAGNVLPEEYYSYSVTSDVVISKVGSKAEPQKVTTTSNAKPEEEKQPLLKRIFGPKEPELESVGAINEQVFLELEAINGRLAGRTSAKVIKKVNKSR